MTKSAYFDMCEALGSEPLDSETPVEYDDFCIDVQEVLVIYQKLADDWDTVNGNYLGKNYAGILDILTILEIPREDRRTVFDLIGIIDRHRAKAIAEAKPKQAT